MSKKNRQMDKHFQIYNMNRILKLELDYFSLIDSTLYFPENYKNIKNNRRYNE